MAFQGMKRALYNIADEEFVTLLDRTRAAFDAKGVKYMFVGGVATQAHIANYLCAQYNAPLLKLIDSPDFRIQDHLRATDDADITLDTRGVEIIEFSRKLLSTFEEMQKNSPYVSPSGNHIVDIALNRQGIKRPVFILGLDDVAQNPEKTIAFNLYNGPEDTNDRWGIDIQEFERRHYIEFMNRGVVLNIPLFGDTPTSLRVKNVEDLLATKIARAREKDWGDMLLLARHSYEAGKPINYEAVREILCSPDPANGIVNLTFQEKFETFMDLKDKTSVH